MSKTFRILIVDDNPAIHEDYSQILSAKDELSPLQLLPEIPGVTPPPQKKEDVPTYLLDHAYQGIESVEMVQKSLDENNPYALVFMDVRMPPGLDGIDSIARIWALDPQIEVVMCTAFSDYSWEKVIARLGGTSQLMILKKPFDVIEVKQMALSLTTKWSLAQENQKFITELQHEKEELAKSHALAEESSIIKSDFIAIISHELKTPLTAILGYTDLLLHNIRHNAEPDAETEKDSIERIDINAHKLNDLIKDILLVSEIESGTINCSADIFSPTQSISRILEGFTNLCEERNLTIVHTTKRDSVFLNSDRVKFETIITNLLSNAIKFTKDGSITIDSDMDDEFIHISVTDTGIGIAKDKFTLIFEKFRQADQSLTRGYSGTGIGLAIALRMTKLLGGTITLESEEGKGSTFTFSIKRDLRS